MSQDVKTNYLFKILQNTTKKNIFLFFISTKHPVKKRKNNAVVVFVIFMMNKVMIKKGIRMRQIFKSKINIKKE